MNKKLQQYGISDCKDELDNAAKNYYCHAHSLLLVVRHGPKKLRRSALKTAIAKASNIVNFVRKSVNASEKVQVGIDQEKAQSEKDSHSKYPRWEKPRVTIRYLYHENIS